MMLRVFSLITLLLFSFSGFALPTTARYQVDVIVFTHAYTANGQQENAPPLTLTHDARHAIPLQSHDTPGTRTYRLMPISSSSLRNEWSRLNQQSQYRALFHYTWLQPSNNQHPVALSARLNNGWNVEGTLRVRQSNYYLLDTDLRFSAPNNHQPAFVFSQKQRLKAGRTYYLDHPQAGMLINVHRVA